MPFVCTMTKTKDGKKFDRKKHATKLHLLNQGPNAGNSSLNAAAVTEKKLKKLQKDLGRSSGGAVDTVAPRRSVGQLPAYRTAAPAKKKSVSSSSVEPLAVYTYVSKHYPDVNNVNWSAVADVFRLSDHKTAQRKFNKHVASLTPKEEIIWPTIACLDQKHKKKLLEIRAQYDGVRIQQLQTEQWKTKIKEQLLAQFQEKEAAPNASLDDIKSPSKKTYKKILDFLVPKEVNTKKKLTEGRLTANDEPRNPFTLACVVQALMHDRPQAKELVDSSDMFTLFVDPSTGKSRAVRMTQATWEALRAEHLGPGYADDDSKKTSKKPVLSKVGIPNYACIQASGDVRAIVIIFIDLAIPKVAVGKRYSIYPLQCNGSFKNPVHNSFVFAAMVNAEFEEDCLMQQIWAQIIIPKSEKTASDLIRAAMTPIQVLPEPSASRSMARAVRGSVVPDANSSSRSIVGGACIQCVHVFVVVTS